MRMGLHALGIGAGAQRAVIDAVASDRAEDATKWVAALAEWWMTALPQ